MRFDIVEEFLFGIEGEFGVDEIDEFVEDGILDSGGVWAACEIGRRNVSVGGGWLGGDSLGVGCGGFLLLVSESVLFSESILFSDSFLFF